MINPLTNKNTFQQIYLLQLKSLEVNFLYLFLFFFHITIFGEYLIIHIMFFIISTNFRIILFHFNRFRAVRQ